MQPPPMMGYAGYVPVFGVHAGGPQFAVDAGKLSNGTWVEAEGPTVRVGTIDPVQIQPVLDALRAAGLTIRRMLPVRQSLEDLFMEAVTDPVTGQALAPGADRNRGFQPITPPAPVAPYMPPPSQPYGGAR